MTLENSEFPGPWSEILENWTISNRDSVKSRMSKVMKIGDTGLSITSKITSMNKRDVSETDLYLLGKNHFNYAKNKCKIKIFINNY